MRTTKDPPAGGSQTLRSEITDTGKLGVKYKATEDTSFSFACPRCCSAVFHRASGHLEDETRQGAIVVASRLKGGKNKSPISLAFRTLLPPPKCKIGRTHLTPPE